MEKGGRSGWIFVSFVNLNKVSQKNGDLVGLLELV